MIAALGRPKEGACSYTTGQITYPVSFIYAPLEHRSPPFGRFAFWNTVDEFTEEPDFKEYEPALNSGNGATTTLVAASSRPAAMPYSCAVIAVTEYNPLGRPAAVDEISFQISSPPAPSPSPPTPSPPKPAASTGALSIPAQQTLELKRETWTKVQVKISNPGGDVIGEKAKPMSTVFLTAVTDAGLTAKSDLIVRATR